MGSRSSKKKRKDGDVQTASDDMDSLRRRRKVDTDAAARALAVDHLEKLRQQQHTHKASSLQEYFLGQAYDEGLPCKVVGYTEDVYTNGEIQIPILRHAATGIQVWQFALDLRYKTRDAVVEELFDSHDVDGSGLLDRNELKVALRQLGFGLSTDDLWEAMRPHGGYRRGAIRREDFLNLVARKYSEHVCLFAFTDEKRFRSITEPGMKLSHIWTSLASEDRSELGPGLHANSKAPDQWESQMEVMINNRWPGEAVASRYGDDIKAPRKAPRHSGLNQFLLRTGGEHSTAFCIPILCGREAASDLRNSKGEGYNAYGEELLPWRDVWVIDLAWGGLHSKDAVLPNVGTGLLSECPAFDSLLRALRARIKWRDAQFGYNDPLTAVYLDQLACMRLARERLHLAGPLLRRAFAARQEVFGWDDLRTATSAASLGLFLSRCDEDQEAEDLLRYALVFRARKLGDTHPDTIASMGNLAIHLRKKTLLVEWRKEEATTLLFRCLEACRKVVESRRLDALECLTSAGPLLVKGGQRDEHARLIQRAKAAELDRMMRQQRAMTASLIKKAKNFAPEGGVEQGKATLAMTRAQGDPADPAQEPNGGHERARRPRRMTKPQRRRKRDSSHRVVINPTVGKLWVAPVVGQLTDAERAHITTLEKTTLQRLPSLPLNRM